MYTPQSSEIYTKNVRVVQHAQNDRIHYINKTKDKNHIIKHGQKGRIQAYQGA